MGKDIERVAALPPLMLGGSLWAIRSDALPRLFDLARVVAHDPAAALATTVDAPAPSGPGVQILTLTGVLTPFGSLLSFLFGGGSGGVQGFRDQLARAVADPEVAAIVLDIDSPGGSCGLVAEAAADVLAAREVKPVYAVADVQACSGAYWIGSQATEFYCTPSGMVGSVGVYYVHEDYSAMNEKMGVDVTYIYSGKYKTEGNADEPLSEDAQAAWQADADTIYAQFVNGVAAGRGVSASTVRSGYGEGRALLADDALAAGMVDGVMTLQSVVTRALTEAVTSSGAHARRFGHAQASRRVALAAAGEADEPAPAEPPAEPDVAPSAPAPEVPEPDVAPSAPAPEVPEPDVAPSAPADGDEGEEGEEPEEAAPASAGALPESLDARRLLAQKKLTAVP